MVVPLQFVKEQTENICIEAVKEDDQVLQYVEKCFYNICLKI
jgi:hypothetical protein